MAYQLFCFIWPLDGCEETDLLILQIALAIKIYETNSKIYVFNINRMKWPVRFISVTVYETEMIWKNSEPSINFISLQVAKVLS